MQNISQKIIGAEFLTEVTAYLKNADKYIRQGDVHRALDEIARAREKNPTIMYARAYEEYVRSVLLKHTDEESGSGDGSQEAVIRQLLPTLEKILDLAIKEVKRSAVSAYRQKQVIALQKKHEEAQRSEEQQRASGIAKKIAEYLGQARAFVSKNDFHNALNEVARAFMLDPIDEQILRIEEEIKTAQENHTREKESLERAQEQEENRRREELFAQWRQRRQDEKEQEQKKKEEASKQARSQKIREYLQMTRELFAADKAEEARLQLAFVMVLDPLNEEVMDLDWKIGEALAKKAETDVALKKRKAEEEKKKAVSMQSTIVKDLEKAEELLAQQKFSEALHIITQAYYIDPTNEHVIAAEKRIMAAEEEALHLKEEHAKREEEERKRKQEAELHRLSIEQQKRVQIRERIEAEAKLLRDEQEVLLSLSRARGHASKGQYDEALKQIAQAFKINPFDEEVAKLQREIVEGRKQAKLGKKSASHTPAEAKLQEDHETVQRIRQHAEKAKVLRSELRYQEALDEIAQAYSLDPANEMLFALEGEIQQEFLRYEEEQHRAQESFKNEQGIKKSLAMAREALSREAYGEALAWVDYALSFDMQHFETLQLKDEIERAQRLLDERKADEEKEIVVQFHLGKAAEFLSANRIAEAMLEADLALRLHSGHPGALAMRKQLNALSAGTILPASSAHAG